MKLSARHSLLLFIPLLASCASKKELYQHSQFVTRISNSGLKHFQVSVQTPESSQHYNEPGAPHGEHQRPANQLRAILVNAADAHLEKNNFCREGYWVLNLDVRSPIVSLRGECNDKASEEEREKFPDTIAEW